jgi:hypothetical protein
VPVTDAAYGNIATSNTQITEERTVGERTKTEDIVRTYFSDIPVMIQIARCESTFRHTLSDGTVLQGKVDPADTGVMQINARYHGIEAEKLGLDLTDLYDNMAYARDLYERQGTRPWNASAPCWERTIAMR